MRNTGVIFIAPGATYVSKKLLTGGLTPFGTLAGLGMRGAGPGDGGSASEGGGASTFSSPEPGRVFGSGIAAGGGMFAGGTTIDGGAVASVALSTREQITT